MKSNKHYDASFGDYTGRTRWLVKHAMYQDCVARAPDDIAAIKAAADWWGEDWLEAQFYMNCKVRKL